MAQDALYLYPLWQQWALKGSDQVLSVNILLSDWTCHSRSAARFNSLDLSRYVTQVRNYLYNSQVNHKWQKMLTTAQLRWSQLNIDIILLPALHYASAGLCERNVSVCWSSRPSVARRYCYQNEKI